MIYFLFFVAVCTLYFENEIKKYAFEVYKFIEFIHENNPLLLNYYENENEYSEFYDSNREEKEEKKEKEKTKEQQVELYENKYLKKFKNFTDDYLFNEKDLEYEQNIFNKLLNHHYSSIEKLNCDINCHTLNLNRLLDNEEDFGKELLKKYVNGEMEKIDDENDETEFEVEVYNDYEKLSYLKEQIANQRYKLEKMSCELSILKEKSKEQLNDELKEKAHTNMIENKLNQFINNYIIEYTPVGNIIMRFNNDKKSFEYYSNNSVPYRYLEPIGRKYVLTYRCKNIFIDMDEEVEKVNKLNELKKNEKNNGTNKNNKSFGKIQTFKQQLVNKKIDIPANRINQSIINPINDADIAIKESNRYIWEGRIGDFKIIKSDKKCNRNNISFKEFKIRQNLK
jgi:hypothetical protein